MVECSYMGGGHCRRPITTADEQITNGDSGTLCAHHYPMMRRERRALLAFAALVALLIAGVTTVAIIALS